MNRLKWFSAVRTLERLSKPRKVTSVLNSEITSISMSSEATAGRISLTGSWVSPLPVMMKPTRVSFSAASSSAQPFWLARVITGLISVSVTSASTGST